MNTAQANFNVRWLGGLNFFFWGPKPVIVLIV
jgi:hypothetical protein